MRGELVIWLSVIAMSLNLVGAIMQGSVLRACVAGVLGLIGIIMLIRGRRDPLRRRMRERR